MKLTPVPYEQKHDDIWNDFVYKHPIGWFWHTSYRLKHALNCSFKYLSENHSFLLFENNEVLAIAPLTFHINNETGEKIAHYSGGGIPFPLVRPQLSEKRKERLLRDIFEYFDEWALENGILMSEFKLPTTYRMAVESPISNLLLKYGFIDSSFHTQTIPLNNNEQSLYDNLDTNHKRAIKKARQILKVSIHDCSNITKETFTRFNDYYFKIAGKVTRPKLTFDMLYDYIRNGCALLAEAIYKGETVGFVVALLYKMESYYLMGASNRDFSHCPIAHYMQWEIVRYLIKKEYISYEIGFQDYGPTLFGIPTQKERDISRFKRGFGGTTLMHYRGEKFYSKDYFNAKFKERMNNYSEEFFTLQCSGR